VGDVNVHIWLNWLKLGFQWKLGGWNVKDVCMILFTKFYMKPPISCEDSFMYLHGEYMYIPNEG